jgi:predicted dehydrogenase
VAPVDVVLVGLHFGRTVLNNLLAAGAAAVRVVGVCDLDQELAGTTAAAIGVRRYPDLAAVLDDPGVPAVALFTGAAGRAELIRQAIRAGKHVMTTKPFEVDPYAARDVLGEARERGLAVQLNSPPAVVPADLVQIERWRDTLALGRPVGAQASVWAAYRETPDGGWYDDPARCPVAPVSRLGIYLINDLIRLFGPAREVQVLERRLRTGRPTPDNAHLTIGFDGGVIGAVLASFCVDDGRPHRDRLTVVYEGGSITRTRDERGKTRLELLRAGHPAEVRTLPAGGDGGYHWDAFARRVRAGGTAPAGDPAGGQRAADIVAGVCVLEAMSRASRSRRIEDVLTIADGCR